MFTTFFKFCFAGLGKCNFTTETYLNEFGDDLDTSKNDHFSTPKASKEVMPMVPEFNGKKCTTHLAAAQEAGHGVSMVDPPFV